MADILGVLLSAGIDKQASIAKIQADLNEIGKALKLQMVADSSALDKLAQEFKNVGSNLDKSFSGIGSNLDKVTNKIKFLADGTKTAEQNIKEFNYGVGKTQKIVEDLNVSTGEVVQTTKTLSNNFKIQAKELEKIKLLEDKQANKEYVNSMQAKMLEIEQRNNAEKQREIELEKQLQKEYVRSMQAKMQAIEQRNKFEVKEDAAAEAQAQREYVNSMMAQIRAIQQRNAEEERLAGILESNTQKLDLFKQKMLGDGTFLGEIDIASQKYSGKINANALSQIRQEVQNLSADTPDLENKIKSLGIQFSSLKQQASQSGTVMGRMFENMTKFLRFYLVGGLLVKFVNQIRDGIDSIVQLDASLTELNKVSDLTSGQLQRITKDAYEAGASIGRTGKEVIDATTEFKRAGFEISESFSLAQNALVLTNIGDGITDVKESASSLIAVLRGFKMEASETSHIIDALNEVSNNFAVDTNNLTEIMKRVSGTIAQTGTSYEQLLGLATGGFESLRNAEMVASGINMISQRLRGMSEDGESITGLMPKLQAAFDKYTNSTVSVIDKQNGGLNDTYTILQQLSKVYPTLSEEARAYLNELIAGNRQNKVLVAIMESWQQVELATESAKNSLGSSIKENEKYLNSINGKIAQFNSSVQQLWQSIISSDLIKFFVDLGNTVIKTLDSGFVRFISTIALTTTTFGLLGKAITALKATTLAYTIQQNLLMISTNGLKTTIQSLWVTMSASPLFWVAAATATVIGLVKVFDALNVSVEEQRAKVDELNKGYNDLKAKIKSLREVQNPTKEQIEYIGLLERELELQGEILKIEQKRLMEKEVYGSGRLAKEVEKNLQTIDEYTEGMKYAQSELQRVLSTYTEEELLKYSDDDTWIEHIEDLKDQTKELELELIKQKTTIDDYIKTLGNEAPQKLKDLSKSIEDALPKIQALNGGIKDTDTTTEKYIPTLEELTKAYEEATDAIDNYQSSAKQLSDIYDTINEDGKVSADTLIDLIQKYPQLASEIANMNSSKEAGLNLTKQLFELEKGNAIAELTDNKAILDSKLAILEADEKKYKLMREIAMQNNDSYGVGQASKLLAALDLGDLRNQSNAIVQAIGMITGLTLDDFQSKSSSPSSTSKTLTSMETADQSKLTEAFIKSANAESKITEAKEKSLKAQIKLSDQQKDYNKQIELTNKLISNQQQQISDLQTANEKIHQRANEIRAGVGERYDTTQWFDPTGQSTAVYDNFIIGFTDRKNKIIAEMNKLEAKSSLTKVEKEQLKSFENQLNAIETEQKYVEDLFASLQKLKQAYYDNADSIVALNDEVASSNQKIIDIKKEELEILEQQAEQTRKNQIESQKQLLEKYKQQEESLKNIIDLTTNLIKQEYQDIIDKLEDQLDAHKEITDEIKKQIKLQEANDDYRKDEKKKQDEILKLQRKITELSRDDSRQAQAEKLKLEEDLAKKQEDLSEFRHDRDIELQLEALDEGQKAFEDKQKEEIDKYKQKLSEAGTLQQEAITRINDALATGSDTLYGSLISWNQKYGSSIQDDIVSAWKNAKDAMLDYQSSSGGLNIEGAMTKTREAQIIAQMQQNSISWHGATSEERIRLHEENIRLAKQLSGSVEFLKGKWWQNGIPIYGQGAYVDKPHLSVVGDRPEFIIPKENIMDFVNKVNMMNIPVPKMPNFNPLQNSNALKIDSLITINGNADRTILPDLERIANTVVDKINNGFYKVGKMKPIRTLG